MLLIKLVKSPIGNTTRNRRTAIALGLRKVHQVVEQPDNPSIRGMIHKIQHMVTFEVVEGEPSRAPKAVKASGPKQVVAKSKPAGKAAAKPAAAEAKPKKGAEKPIEEAPEADAEAKPKRASKPKAEEKVEEKA